MKHNNERDSFMELLWDHSRENSAMRKVRDAPPPPVLTATGDGLPTCNDSVTLWVGASEGRVVWARHAGYGCAVSQAGASLLCHHVQGVELERVVLLAGRAIVAAEGGDVSWEGTGLSGEAQDELSLYFRNVGLSKRKCARLAWRVLIRAAKKTTSSSV